MSITAKLNKSLRLVISFLTRPIDTTVWIEVAGSYTYPESTPCEIGPYAASEDFSHYRGKIRPFVEKYPPSGFWASARAFKANKRDRISLIEPGILPSVDVMNNPG